MYLSNFDYYAPASIPEVNELLIQFGPRAMMMAGGTDILAKMKDGLIEPEVIISLKNLAELKKIEYVPGKGVIIGARVTHNELVDSEILHKKYMSVSEAAHKIAANQIRHTGTIGGNLINAVPSADLPPILIALNASVKLVGVNSVRTIPLEELFTGVCETCRAQSEILTEIVIPDQKMTGSTYAKFGLRRSGALAVVGVASAVEAEGNIIKDVRIVFGAVAPTPIRTPKAEEFLKGKKISDEVLEEAGVIASQEAKPISDIRASAEYRTDLLRVFTRRTLRKAIDNGHV